MSIFSRIITGEIPCTKVYEDDLCIAFLDIRPVTKGHTLVIPKQEIQRLRQLPPDLLHHCMDITQKLMKAMIEKLGCDYVRVSVVGTEVPHCHIHLVPKMFTTQTHEQSYINYKEGEMSAIAEKIRIGV